MSRQKKIKTTTTVQEEETTNPAARSVREFLETGVYPDDLDACQFKIDVQKYNRDGKPVRITNAVYDNLENLPDQLGTRFGAGRFRLFISVLDDQGKKVAFVRVEDFELESGLEPDQDAAGADQLDQDGRRTTAADVQMLKMQQDHEMLLRMLDQNTKIVIAALTAKGAGGGPGLSTIVQAVKLGRDMAAGFSPGDDAGPEGSEAPAAEGPDGIMQLLANPLIQKIAGSLVDAASRRAASPAASPAKTIDGPAAIPAPGDNGTGD